MTTTTTTSAARRTRPATPVLPTGPTGPTGQTWSRGLDSPVGSLTLVVSAHGIRALLWPAASIDVGRPVTHDDVSPPTAVATTMDATQRQLEEYFAGTRTSFDLPLDALGTPFQLLAWTTLRGIPYGQTVSYGEQARRLGDALKARAVGAANGRNPISIIVPCHRVVGADGSLTGFAGGLAAKSWLLDHERGISRLA